MKISTRLLVAVFMPLLTALIVCAAIWLSYRTVQLAQSNGDVVRQMRSNITDLNSIIYSYILNHDERPREQFAAAYSSLTARIGELNLRDADQQELLDGLRTNSEAINSTFLKLVSNYEAARASGNSQLLDEAEAVLTGQLLVSLHDADENASLLRSAIDGDIGRSQTRTFILVTAVAIIAAAATAYVLMRTRRRVVRPLATLQRGADTIGSGNLDFKIEEKAKDEIGDLSRAFNRMAASLKSVTASKTDLEKEVAARQSAEKELRVTNEMLQEQTLELEAEIEERKRSAEALQEASQKYRALFNNETVGLAYCQTVFNDRGEAVDYVVLDVNATYERLVGVKRDQVVDKKITEVFPGVSRELVDRHNRVAVSGEAAHFEIAEPTIEKWFDVNVFCPQRGYFVSIFYDVSDRRKAEEALHKRTAELEIANKELESFSYSVSHDLRAPLRTLDGFSQIVGEDYADRVDDAGRYYLSRIRNAAQTMSQLIDDILKLSRATRTEMHIEGVNLSEMVRAVASELQAAYPERRVELMIAPEVFVEGDKSLLQIALWNLLDNAWKYTGKLPQARIEFGAMQDNGGRVYYVRDNGVGFDMQYADKLFQPFQRLHSGEEYSGTGIGLATAQRVVRRHGGRIWAESGVGQGATFYFTLDMQAVTSG